MNDRHDHDWHDHDWHDHDWNDRAVDGALRELHGETPPDLLASVLQRLHAGPTAPAPRRRSIGPAGALAGALCAIAAMVLLWLFAAAPSVPATVDRSSPVFSFLTFTAAPATAAPFLSTTVPAMRPSSDCADMVINEKNTIIKIVEIVFARSCGFILTPFRNN